MKTLRLFGMAIMMVLVASSFISCSSDDDGDNASASKIEGVWNLTHLKGYKWENFDEDTPRPFTDGAYRVTFKSDGTFLGETYYGDNRYGVKGWNPSEANLELSDGRYEVGEGILYLKSYREVEIYKIKSLSGSKMVLHKEWQVDDETLWADLTFTKQK